MRAVLTLKNFKTQQRELHSRFKLQNSVRLLDSFSENLTLRNTLRSFLRLSVQLKNPLSQLLLRCLNNMRNRSLTQSSNSLCQMRKQIPLSFSLELRKVTWMIRKTQVELRNRYSRSFLNSSAFRLIESTRMLSLQLTSFTRRTAIRRESLQLHWTDSLKCLMEMTVAQKKLSSSAKVVSTPVLLYHHQTHLL